MAKPSDDLQAILPLIQRFVGTQPDALEQIRAQVLNEVANYENALRQAKAQLVAVDQVIAGLKKAPPAADNGSPPVAVRPVAAPPLRKAILMLLTEVSPTYLTRDDILAELARRGWSPGGKTPRNTVISRLSELARDGAIKRDKNRYWLPEPADREATQ